MRLIIPVIIFSIVQVAIARAEPCLHDGDRVSGEVRNVETRHPGNGKLLSYRFLVTFKPVCVDNKDLGHAEGRWIQIVLADQKEISRLTLGDTATIMASYEPPLSAYHLGDLMAFRAQIVSVTPP
jgi:hypothetical protein